MSILTVSGLTTSYGPTFIFGDRTFRVARGETIGVVGVNGAGTSTLLTIAADVAVPTCGGVSCPQTTRIACLAQEARVARAGRHADAMLAALCTSRRLRNRSSEGGL